jgi:hypothetical protein
LLDHDGAGLASDDINRVEIAIADLSRDPGGAIGTEQVIDVRDVFQELRDGRVR